MHQRLLALGSLALLSVGIYRCSSAAAADGEASPHSTQTALASSANKNAPSVPVDAPPPDHKPPQEQTPGPPPAGSGEAVGSTALEQRLDRLEKDIQGPQL